MISLPWGKRLIRLGPMAETSLYKIAHLLCALCCQNSVAGHPAIELLAMMTRTELNDVSAVSHMGA
jgi:hypothetical protein